MDITYVITSTENPIVNVAEISDDNADEFTDAEGNPMSDIDSEADSNQGNDEFG